MKLTEKLNNLLEGDSEAATYIARQAGLRADKVDLLIKELGIDGADFASAIAGKKLSAMDDVLTALVGNAKHMKSAKAKIKKVLG